jgi:hypothetical protein
VRYRDIAENRRRLCANFTLINLYLNDRAPRGASLPAEKQIPSLATHNGIALP